MASSSALCTLAGARLISSGQHQVGEDGAALGHEFVGLRAIDRRAHDVGGQQVGGELQALEAQVKAVGHRLDRQRLGQAGHALEQHVTAGQQSDEDALHHGALADDHLADLGEEALRERGFLLHELVGDADVVGHAAGSPWAAGGGSGWRLRQGSSRASDCSRSAAGRRCQRSLRG